MEMRLNPARTGKGAKAWEKYIALEKRAESLPSSFSSQERSEAWAKVQAAYVAFRKAEHLPLDSEDDE